MKKIILLLIILLAFQSSHALNIQQVIAEPQGNDVNIRLTVSESHYFEYVGYSYVLDNGTITMIVCYNPITLSVITTNEQNLLIEGINSQSENYTIVIVANYLHYENGQQLCDQQENSDSFTGYFSTPLQTPQVLSSKIYKFESDQIVLFPNPTRDFIKYKSAIQNINSILIYDSLGRLVKVFLDDINKLLDLTNMSSGIYYAHFIIENKKVVKKIILSQ